MSTPERSNRVLDAGALRALAHPMRIRILDLLNERGPQTSSSLGAILGQSSGVTSYHLRALAKHDLIREVPGRGTARERWWERPPGSLTMSSHNATSSPAEHAASQLVVLELYRQRNERLMRYLETSPADDDGLLTMSTARLTPAQFRELGQELESVIQRTSDRYRDQQGEDVRPYSIRLDLIPIAPDGQGSAD